MYKGISVAMLIAGCVLAAWGVTAFLSFSSDVSRAVTGSPTNRAMWLLLGGIGLAIVGLFGLLAGPQVP